MEQEYSRRETKSETYSVAADRSVKTFHILLEGRLRRCTTALKASNSFGCKFVSDFPSDKFMALSNSSFDTAYTAAI